MPRGKLFSFFIPAIVVLALTAAACGPDLGQAKLCERALLKLADDPNSIEIMARSEAADPVVSIRLDYKLNGPSKTSAAKRWIKCRFDGGGSSRGRLELVGVETSSLGKLSLVALVHLRRRMGYRRPPPERTRK